MRALLLLCTVGVVMASVIHLTSAANMPQGYNARAPARSMEENADECMYNIVSRHLQERMSAKGHITQNILIASKLSLFI